MRILESFENLNAGYLAIYNINLAFVTIPSADLNPIVKDYRNAVTTLEETCEILHTYFDNRGYTL